MAVTKIQRVNSLHRSVNYITRSDKTESDLIYSFNCTPETVTRDYKYVLDRYNEANNQSRELKPRMIIQSYSPDENITPEQAHEYGKEFAKNYLNNDYQYIIATHHDTDHIHNHIIFNDINFNTLKVFDSKKENTIYRMRNENDLISDKYGLKVIEATREKHKYLSFKEYVARSKGTSFKSKVENDIDEAILGSHSFDEFIKKMEKKGYEHKQGKYLSFKSPNSKRFMRTKTLGFNYLENSIRYRIDNKEYIPLKTNVTSREWIDKNQQKFKENKGLRRWGSIQNINYLNEVYTILQKENISLEQFTKQKQTNENLMDSLERKLTKIDNDIYQIEKMSNAFDVYKDSYSMIKEFKSLETDNEKQAFKKENYSKFKQYDMAKKNINVLKKFYNVQSKEGLEKKVSSLKKERDLIYSSVNINKIEEKEIEKMDIRDQQERKRKRKEMER